VFIAESNHLTQSILAKPEIKSWDCGQKDRRTRIGATTHYFAFKLQRRNMRRTDYSRSNRRRTEMLAALLSAPSTQDHVGAVDARAIPRIQLCCLRSDMRIPQSRFR